MYPVFENLNFFSYPIYKGFYSLGFINFHRPDINLIVTDQMETYDQWQILLNSEIKSNQINALLLHEEDFPSICENDHRIIDLLNSLVDNNVYCISQLDPFSRKVYSHQIPIELPIIELPWWLVNEILTYHFAKKFFNINIKELPRKNFVCTIARPEKHKNELGIQLIHRFNDIGHVFFHEVPKEIEKRGQKSPFDCYTTRKNYLDDYPNGNSMKMNSKQLQNIKVSLNTENIAGFETFLKNIPLVVHPESSMGIFLTTEKTTWPIQLGKLQLIAAKPYHYQDIQRFIETDLEQIFDLEFDKIQAYTDEQQQEKIKVMLESNAYHIKHSFDLFNQHCQSLEKDKINIARKYYNFFVQQLDKIK